MCDKITKTATVHVLVAIQSHNAKNIFEYIEVTVVTVDDTSIN